MPKAKVLVIEDDRSLADVLVYNLTQAGYRVSQASDGRDGLTQAQTQLPDLVVLDLMLPILDGLEVCRRLRSDERTRSMLIVMLTARSEETDQVVGFSLGADDYVTKPFSVKVLLERVKALLRRRQAAGEPASIVTSQGIVVDRLGHRALAAGCELPLTRSEFRLLDTLIAQAGRVFNRAELITAALGDDALVLDRTIDVHIRALRRKLGDHAHLIETVRGVGYRFRNPSAVELP